MATAKVTPLLVVEKMECEEGVRRRNIPDTGIDAGIDDERVSLIVQAVRCGAHMARSQTQGPRA